MSLQHLVFRHRNHGFTDAGNTFFREMLESNLTVVAIQVDTIVSQCIAMGRQCVVRAAGIVARTLASIVAQEHASGVDNLLGKLVVVLGGDDQMLRGIRVTAISRRGRAFNCSLTCSLTFPIISSEVEMRKT